MTTAMLPTESLAEGKPAPDSAAGPQGARRYIYCVVDGEAPAGFGAIGVGGNADVFAVARDGLSAIVSATSAEKLDITRGNAIAHQRVLEAVMRAGHTVLPVRFNTIAEDKGPKSAQQRIIDHVLVGRRAEIVPLLARMRTVVELGVKGLWTNLAAVFRDLAGGSREIQSLRKNLLATTGPGTPGRRPVNVTVQIRLGELVKKALEAAKSDMEAALLGRLTPLAKDSRKNKTFGDPMFANLALLVEASRQGEVEAVLSAFEAERAGQVKLRCVGPLPACNFLELVITWDD